MPHIPRFESTKLGYDQFCQLVEAIRAEGLVAMSTPFDEEGVSWCCDQGLDVIKVASCSAMDWPLLEAVARAKKPVIISTGGKTISDIDKIYNFFTHRRVPFAFMHCVAEYPAPMERLQLDFIDKLKCRYQGIAVGYSGHEDPDDNMVPMMAVAKGATSFERHVGRPAETISLIAFSMNTSQPEGGFKALLSAMEVCSMKKRDTKFISQAELDSLDSLMRGCYAAKEIKKGHVISREDVFFAMPRQERQLPSGQFEEGVVATAATAVLSPIPPLFECCFATVVSLPRDVIHEAKGLLMESGIQIGDDFSVDLSHHYGIRHFRKTGAILISIINREYCKKLLIVLPGQEHPNHLHKVKEETFQLLYGDLDIEIDGQLRHMAPGDIQTVLRGQMHNFSSVNGAIFEEVSTTHIKNDSYYEDEAISRQDIMNRKTVLSEW